MKLQKKNVAYTEVGEIPGNLPSLQLPTQQAGGTLKKNKPTTKNPTYYFILLLVWIGQWLVKIYGFRSTKVEQAI